MPLTDRAKNFLLGLPDGFEEKDNPFVRDKDVLYIRFDGMRIEIPDDKIGGIVVVWTWRCHDTYRQRLERYEAGDAISFNGIEGRFSLSFET